MTRDEARRAAEVMLAYADGAKLQVRLKTGDWNRYGECPIMFNWERCEYRIAPSTPDTINWDHVAPEYKWMALDEDGTTWLFEKKPDRQNTCWLARSGLARRADSFASYQRGTCDWKDSLVEREAVQCTGS